MSLTCAIDVRGHTATVRFTGEIDMATSALMRDSLEAALELPGIRRIDVDLSAVAFMDSTGISVLLAVQRMSREQDIDLALSQITDDIALALRIVGLLDGLMRAKHLAG